MAGLLRRVDPGTAEANVARFRDGLLFQWIVAGIDGHAKNFSIMLPGAGAAYLSPLYDVGSWLPYRKGEPIGIFRLAMKIGEGYRIESADHPTAMGLTAEKLGLDPRATGERAAELAGRFPEALDRAIEALPSGMADWACVDVLRFELSARAASCRSVAERAVSETRSA